MALDHFLHQRLLEDRARTGEVVAELRLCRRVLQVARRQGWPKLSLATDLGQRTIRPTPAAWQHFVCSQSPAVLVRTLYALWPEPASGDAALR
jgi:hypothetical protein